MINDARKVLELIHPDDRVLDIGGASEVFPRANVVIDIVPYESRIPGQIKDMPEQFSKDTWITGDICTQTIWQNFSEKEFDFVICSHVLEDIRDPIFVSEQMMRISKAGYIEVPSKFRECCKPASNAIMTGWEHHKWLVEYVNDTLIFAPKLPYFTHFDFLGDSRREKMYDYFRQFISLHWFGSFNCAERVMKGSPLEIENMFYYFDTCLGTPTVASFTASNVPCSSSTLLWIDDFKLPIEEILSIPEIIQNYKLRGRDLQVDNKVPMPLNMKVKSFLTELRKIKNQLRR